ncbi:JNK-interacting protein 1-like isoform X2 [Xenia sp. Carnegie-2017]|uniref:JNK-interacting protein 1-like isoform X2 n=1 Tax=Xenia sp. Carnegie-2017 TaxID=2897299 RepID=UPI001F047FB8|nr:JNK-interacting protein 1-like isoform X2 [Xenia sp. Carnegie-2017]
MKTASPVTKRKERTYGQAYSFKTLPKDSHGSRKIALKKSQSAQGISSYGFNGFSSTECAVVTDSERNTTAHVSEIRERLPNCSGHVQLREGDLQTHFAAYKFLPRHDNELELDVGDAICVKHISSDLWCEGKNLRSGKTGIFPSHFVSDILSYTGEKIKYDLSQNGMQFYLKFLGSVEVFVLKGINVLQEAITKILSLRTKNKVHDWSPCTLEIDERGIRLIDHAQENEKQQNKSLVGRLFNNEQKAAVSKFYFQLKHVTFCGCYSESTRYFGFVTKHPHQQRFACHIFMSEFSTEPVAKAIGQAFKKLSFELRRKSEQ